MPTPRVADQKPRTPQEFMQLLCSSRILADALIARLIPHYERRKWRNVGELAQRLIHDKALTHWQASQLLEGKTRQYLGGLKLLEVVPAVDGTTSFIAEDCRRQKLVQLQWLQPPGRRAPQTENNPAIAWWLATRHRFLRPIYAIESVPQSPLWAVVSDYEDGPPLRDWIARLGVPRFSIAARWISQLCELLAETGPPERSRRLTLDEFQIGVQGQLIWNGLIPDLVDQTVGKPIPWPQQVIRLMINLFEAGIVRPFPEFNDFPEELLTKLNSTKWPKEGRLALQGLLHNGDLRETAEQLHALSSNPPVDQEHLPVHLRREILQDFVRRSPALPAEFLPERDWSTLISPDVLSNSRELAPAKPPVPAHPQPTQRRKHSLIKPLLVPVLLSAAAGLLWSLMWLTGVAQPVQAIEEAVPSAAAKP